MVAVRLERPGLFAMPGRHSQVAAEAEPAEASAASSARATRPATLSAAAPRGRRSAAAGARWDEDKIFGSCDVGADAAAADRTGRADGSARRTCPASARMAERRAGDP